jgi:hypothetical protein
MAAIADYLVARSQAATGLMGAAADNIEIFNHRQDLRVNSDAIDKEVRSASLDFDGRIPGRAADTLRPVAEWMFLRANCLSCYKDTCTAELAF